MGPGPAVGAWGVGSKPGARGLRALGFQKTPLRRATRGGPHAAAAHRGHTRWLRTAARTAAEQQAMVAITCFQLNEALDQGRDAEALAPSEDDDADEGQEALARRSMASARAQKLRCAATATTLAQ